MSAIAPQILVKTPDESILYGAEFAAALDAGESILSITEITQESTGDGTVTISSQSIDGTSVLFRAAAGIDGETYSITVEVLTSAGNSRELICTLRVETVPIAWSSRSELNNMFGTDNVTAWADLTNNADADEIAARVQWAVEEATSEAAMKINGAPSIDYTAAGVVTPNVLRIATTRLAGVLLYEARGIKDSGDDESAGIHRLSAHKKEANKFFRMVRAGQYLSDSSAGSVPSVLSPAAERSLRIEQGIDARSVTWVYVL